MVVIVTLFFHSAEGVAYNIIPQKVIIEKYVGDNVIPTTPSISYPLIVAHVTNLPSFSIVYDCTTL